MFDEGGSPGSRAFAGARRPLRRTFSKAWKGLQNGRLLTRLEDEGIGCLITCDKNLAFQQTIATRRLSVLVLPATNLVLLEPLASSVAASIVQLAPGTVGRLDADGRLTVTGP